VPPWLLALGAIVSPLIIAAFGLLLSLYGLIGAALFSGALLFAALSYCQLHIRILIVIVYEVYSFAVASYLAILGACIVFRECL